MKEPMLQQLGLLVLVTMPCNLWGKENEEKSPENKIAEFVKSNLKSLNTSTIGRMLRGHLWYLLLLSPAEEWSAPVLASRAATLLPPNITADHLGALVDEMAANAAKNPYLHNFLEQHQSHSLASLSPRLIKMLIQSFQMSSPMHSSWKGSTKPCCRTGDSSRHAPAFGQGSTAFGAFGVRECI